MPEKATEISHEEDVGNTHTAVMDAKATLQAREAAVAEHSMTLWTALRVHRQAVMWSIFVSTAIIMEGYDIVLIGSLFGQQAFKKRYGNYYENIQDYQISGPWQVGLSNATTIGAIIGAFGNGWLTHKYGYRKVLAGCMVAVICFIFVPFFAPSIQVLLVGQILCGIPWGALATLAPAYASEVCPLILRGYLTVYVNLCWALGQLIAAGVLAGTESMTTQWAYRIPFAVQWVWPVPLLVVLHFAPESPWWYVRTGRLDQAALSLSRLSSNKTADEIQASVAVMVHTNQIEREISSGTSYLDCFKGVNLRRTEIVCVVFAAQVFSGQQLGGSPTYFFQQAGLPDSVAFQFSVGGLGLASVGTIVSWFLLTFFGRRSIYVIGLGILSALMFILGFIQVGTSSTGGSYAMGSVVLIWLL
jgi:SP family general alpha glucoside:H+ symporter-like MFS transporter